jgi:hypothetical protein
MEHSFIVRFYRDPALKSRPGTQDYFVGLVEDVQNGNKAAFHSQDELVRFLLTGQSLDGSQSNKDDTT